MMEANKVFDYQYERNPAYSSATSQVTFEHWLRLHTSQDLEEFAHDVLGYIAEESQAYQGVFFTQQQDNNECYEATAIYGMHKSQLIQDTFMQPEGILGEVAHSQRPKIFNHLPSKAIQVDFISANISASCIVVLPVLFNKIVYGVLELYYFQPLSQAAQAEVVQMTSIVGATLQGMLDYRKNKYLLEQSDEHREQILSQRDEMEQTIEKLFETQEALEKQKQRTEIAFQNFKSTNKRLMESIKYAKSVQKALLPDNERLGELFSDYFVAYQPKDVVSGDFYWFSKASFINNPTTPFIMAVIDCTGHGVPGGFMSMVGNALLHEIVNIKQVTDPAKILSLLHRGIRDILRQEEEDSSNHDGMEATICRFSPNAQGGFNIVFAGAKHQLYYFQQGKMKQIRGDRKFLGGGELQVPHLTFHNHSFSLQKNEILYLSTDGLLDTCNPQRRKYGTKRWEEIIQSCFEKPLNSQKHIIIKDVLNFKQDGEQRDDITCISIRL